jgi:hypothetical protein
VGGVEGKIERKWREGMYQLTGSGWEKMMRDR